MMKRNYMHGDILTMRVHSKAKLALYALVSLCLFASSASFAKDRADCERDYRPKFGQSGKDVPWEPTTRPIATAMLRLANTTAADRVYDLGAGDGAIVIEAAKQFGAAAVGIEYNPSLAALAQCYIVAEGLEQKAKVIAGDIFKTDFSRATVVTLFLYPEVNLRLRPTLLKMPPGTRVVSHMHGMETWKWDDEVEVDGRRAYLWIVPAAMKENWTFKSAEGSDTFTLTLKQRFQELTGKLRSDGKQTNAMGTLRGTKFTLKLGDGRQLTGTLESDRITASLSDGRVTKQYVGVTVAE
jgi:hypothetical protein